MSIEHLPSRFPVGTRYVVEGRRGRSGRLRIISRQVILPSGKSFNLEAPKPARGRKRQTRRPAK